MTRPPAWAAAAVPTQGPHQALAENLCAAFLAAQMGLKSIDYAKRTYIGPPGSPVGALWHYLADEALRGAS